ncbi:dimethylarginine dimethylaminohydrolase family protein [Ornithinibacillus halophilus]|uniref:N-Dimethylarginine dimethylaminohydrolase n=1 Tax=Ornithinibacillus halophilus TaxID=930117 RepID=A0A1M5FUK5_9BACI|nr:arginine deiminase family protein [Ornithinibacillus halophilus]SHF94851.1 N-Dimethylarginine dimethylaminohydrolase [Ornithinibacillus halophilus]
MQPPKVYCKSEYDILKKVILCEPQYLINRQVLHDPELQYKHVKEHVELAVKQHREFVDTLNKYEIETIMLSPDKHYPEQTYTRDIGFTLGPTIYIAEMAQGVRKGEEHILKYWLHENQISYYNLIGEHIEGGDVIIDQDTIFIGLSSRTNEAAIEHLKQILTGQFHVKMIPFKDKFLHLDCVFNVLSPEVAIIYSEALSNEDIQFLSSRYDLIEVPYEEQHALATNVLSIGSGKVLSLPMNETVNKQMRKKGFEIIEVDISEIVKSGGSFRCCTLPLVRG